MEQKFTKRQREVMQWLANGYTLAATARNLGIGISTAGYHAALCRAKLGVFNVVDLVIVAASRGLVDISRNPQDGHPSAREIEGVN